ncbi:MAG: hypothetical protein V7713_00285 [Marinobacter sp.]
MRCFQARITDDLPNDSLAKYYEQGKALSMAVSLETDAVIDPSETRNWIARGLRSVKKPGPRDGQRRPMIDAW